MQQVGRRHFAKASLVEPARLPVPLRRVRRRGAFDGLGRMRVLHGRLFARAFLVFLLLGIVGAGYWFRAELRAGWAAGVETVAETLAGTGFGVAEISITGQALTREADIVRALGVDRMTSTVNFDAEAARRRIEALPAVRSASIRKFYPAAIEVTIEEIETVARWRIDGRTHLVDAAGNTIATAGLDDGHLPLVIGDGAGNDALVMINLMNRYPALTGELAALSRIGDRRWDLIFYTGLRVQLPESGVAAALGRLDRYHREHQILDRDLDLIDMRVPEFVAVRQTVRDNG